MKIPPYCYQPPHSHAEPGGVDRQRSGIEGPRRGAADDGKRVGSVLRQQLGNGPQHALLVVGARAAAGQLHADSGLCNLGCHLALWFGMQSMQPVAGYFFGSAAAPRAFTTTSKT